MPNFFDSIHLQGILSFAQDSEPIPLGPLNVLIGPNGSGKSNLLEVISLLRAIPVDLAGAIREGGGIGEWLWKGRFGGGPSIECVLQSWAIDQVYESYRYRVELWPGFQESIRMVPENIEMYSSLNDFVLIFEDESLGSELTKITLPALEPERSVLAQVRDRNRYRALTWIGDELQRIAIYQDSSFGRFTAFRQPQPADLPNDNLLPDGRNLALVLNAIEHRGDWERLQSIVKRFIPRFQRLSIKVEAGMVQVFMHETGLDTPTPAVRLSDGTLRFLGLLASRLRR